MILICYYFCFLCPSYKILLNAKVETTQKLQHNNNSYKSSILTTEALLFWQLKPGLGGRHLLYPLCMNLHTHIYIVSGMFFFHILDWVCLTMLYSIVMITMSKISYYLTWSVGQLREPPVLFCLAFYLIDTTGEISRPILTCPPTPLKMHIYNYWIFKTSHLILHK